MKRPLIVATSLLATLFVHSRANAQTVTPTMFVDPTEKISVTTSFLTALGAAFPEGVHISNTLLSPSVDPNLNVTGETKIRVSYLYQGAGWKDSLGYFTWAEDGSQIDILDRQLIFPVASGSSNPLSAGDTVTLRDASGNERIFEPGEHIGFFMVANGWTGSAVSRWNPSNPTFPTTVAANNEPDGDNGYLTTVDLFNPENALGHPELARHAVVLQMDNMPGALSGESTWVLGFEDMLRTLVSCDNDFNDVMFKVQAYDGPEFTTPDEGPIGTSSVPSYDATNPDPDGDGVQGLNDYFPYDPTRAFVESTPASGFETLAFEDLYPRVGDADFNDAVVQYEVDEVLDASNHLKQIAGTYHLIARGAGYDHHFGVAIHGLPEGTTGTITTDAFSTDGVETTTTTTALPAVTQDVGGAWMLRIDDLFPSTRAALPPVSAENGYTNTYFATPSRAPASIRFVATFDTAFDPTPIGTPPFDPYLLAVHPDGLYDIHRPGSLPFANRPAALPTESGSSSFLDAAGFPFELLLPSDWRYPLESVRIDGGGRGLGIPYKQFDTWRTSEGQSMSSWYSAPSTATPASMTNTLSDGARERSWTLVLE